MWSNDYVRPELNVLTNATAFSYGKYLAKPLPGHVGDLDSGGRLVRHRFEDIWRQLAAGLTEGDGGIHLKTSHPESPRSSAMWFHTEKWLDFNMLQTGHTTLNRITDLVAEDWAAFQPSR